MEDSKAEARDDPKESKRKPKWMERPWQGYVFTDFKMESTEEEWQAQVVDGTIAYVKWGVEEAPETKRKHRQGLIWFSSKQRYTLVQSLVKNKCFVEPMKSKDGAMEYVSKMKTNVGGYFEAGEWKKAGQRTDLEVVARACRIADGDVKIIMEQHPGEYLKYHGGIDKMVKKYESLPDYRQIKVFVLNGAPATKKTHYPFCRHGFGNVFLLRRKAYQTNFWEGYEGQKVLMIDEFTIPWIELDDLLQIMEGHPYRVNIKNTSCWGRWRYVYITMNRNPNDKDLYPNVFAKYPETRKAFRSRIKRWLYFDTPYTCHHVVPGEGALYLCTEVG